MEGASKGEEPARLRFLHASGLVAFVLASS